MAYARVNFVQPYSGRMRKAPIGFSWTTLLFGFVPALRRGHRGAALVQLLLQIATFGVSSLFFAFVYNRMYVQHLLDEGYQVRGASRDISYIADEMKMPLPLIGMRPLAA